MFFRRYFTFHQRSYWIVPIEANNKRWKYIKLRIKLTLEEVLLGIRFVLSSTYFTFDNRVYRQSYGTLMDSLLSPIIADIVMQDVELKALNFISFYFRYVDDIIMAIPAGCVEEVLDVFNSIHERLTFTYELQDNNRISFLDLSIIR